VTSPVLRLRVPEDTLARIDQASGDATRSAWVHRLIDRELTGQQPATAPATAPAIALPPGEPYPARSAPDPAAGSATPPDTASAAWSCAPACAAALQGATYKRQPPPGVHKVIRCCAT
jgi:hypothetical protein